MTRLALPTHYRYGQMSAASRPKMVPERYGHAVEPNGAVTLCGRPLHDLHPFAAMFFEDLGHHTRCPTCDEAAGHPRSSHTTRP